MESENILYSNIHNENCVYVLIFGSSGAGLLESISQIQMQENV